VVNAPLSLESAKVQFILIVVKFIFLLVFLPFCRKYKIPNNEPLGNDLAL
jgi:hypothetical protein